MDVTPVPFVVLFMGRSGSTYFVEGLDAHPHVTADYEILSMAAQRGASAGEQLEVARTALTPSGDRSQVARAIGFKVKPWDVLDRDGFVLLLQELRARVILLRRRNLVKLTVSWCNAERLFDRIGDWNAYSSGQTTTDAFEIDAALFDERLQAVALAHDELVHIAESIAMPTLCVYYEDLLQALPESISMVFGFLGVAPVATQGRTVKNTPDDLRSVISNFDELRGRYVDTRFEGMFDQAPVVTPRGRALRHESGLRDGSSRF